ncbi:subtilisin-like protease [Phragmites australis]|uniref:subtilisin-like protease n=1 Tax=Phragmites australis TaxID=29695 RepID=UPI002D792BC7|nr:subtilisin-like protease [Phragmites australis]
MASFACLLVPLLYVTTVLSLAPALCYVNPGANPGQDAEENSEYRTHIVLVWPPADAHAADEVAHRRWHESFLPSSLTEFGEPRLVHSYTEAFSGFAARLTDAELHEVSKKPGFLRAFPDRTQQLMTTHTPEYLGLRQGPGFWRDVARYGKGIVVGLLDVGIYGAHPSFGDNAVAPPPSRWKGSCQGSASRCNKKLVGVKSFVGDDGRDDFGHGTHTSSTAVGNFINGASRNGMAYGTASGIAPGAHVAMYKVCTGKGCQDSAVLAGMDAAIKDGVDVISISIGGNMTFQFDHDPIAIGAFSSVSKGILVVCAAGNNGPKLASVVNDAPWLVTVAASSVDRSFLADVQLGKGVSVAGEAINQVTNSSSKTYPLLYSEERRNCIYHGEESKVAGKIVICDAVDNLLPYNTSEKSILREIKSAGAAGVVLINTNADGYTTVLWDYGSDVVQVTAADGINIKKYEMSSQTNSTSAVTFSHKTVLGVRPSPTVASFSSRGPSTITPGVLKPDILAPGLNILAAYPPQTLLGTGPFNVLSGTSMSTPHISGVAALVKSVHPDWSPAAIKSAIMTTSDTVDKNGGPILDEQHRKANAYATGAGHVNPARATDPGLVYDLGATDYASYICALMGEAALAVIVRNSSLSCAKLPKTAEAQLNYPTIKVPLQPTPFTVSRTVTNVGPAASTYTVKVDAPTSLTVLVSPGTLVFAKAREKKTFNVTVSGHGADVLEGSLLWVSGQHVVRSPIVAVARHG